jgi:membrane-associated phospholipid phosphatase
MRQALKNLPKLLVNCFRGRYLLWQISAIALTYLLVNSGFDWRYLHFIRSSKINNLLFPAVIIGAVLPIFGSLAWLFYAHIRRDSKLIRKVWTFGLAIFTAWFLSSVYKAFTGRIQPDLSNLSIDVSRNFQFGLLDNGIFWGWPSSHTAVAFAGSKALTRSFPKNGKIKIGAWAYALYIGLGVTGSVHWFSEFVAGALIGLAVGSSAADVQSERREKIEK